MKREDLLARNKGRSTMRSGRQTVVQYSFDVQAPRLDLFGEENPIGLLARLKTENSALDSLRLALAGDEERLHQPVK
jgi:hypothetical protein